MTEPFPPAGIDRFLSHFVFMIDKGGRAGQVFFYTWPMLFYAVAVPPASSSAAGDHLATQP